jgi:hypothetical protein
LLGYIQSYTTTSKEKTMIADQQMTTTEKTIERDTPVPSRTQWVERITAALQETVESYIAVGKLLISAKKALPPGEFHRMISKELPFTPRTAQRLMSIAENSALTDATHVSHLPAHWGTLYALSRLPVELVEEKIADGTITPRLQRAEVTRKVEGKEPAATKRRTLDKVQELKKEKEELQAHVAELEAARQVEPENIVLYEPEADPVAIIRANSVAVIRAICCLALVEDINLDELVSLDGLPDRKDIDKAATWLVKLSGALVANSSPAPKAKSVTTTKARRKRRVAVS